MSDFLVADGPRGGGSNRGGTKSLLDATAGTLPKNFFFLGGEGWGCNSYRNGWIQDLRKCTGIMRLAVRAQNWAKSGRRGPKHTRLQTKRLCRELVFNIMEIALVNAASDTIGGPIKPRISNEWKF